MAWGCRVDVGGGVSKVGQVCFFLFVLLFFLLFGNLIQNPCFFRSFFPLSFIFRIFPLIPIFLYYSLCCKMSSVGL